MPLFVGDIVLATIKGRCYGQRILFTQTLRVHTAGDPGQSANFQLGLFAAEIGTGGPTDWLTAYRACLQADYTMLELRTQVVAPIRTAYRSDIFTGIGTGGVGTVANDAAAVTLRTENAGRNQVANKHLGPIPDSVSVQGELTNAYKIILAAFAVKLTQDVVVGAGPLTLRPVIFHRLTNTYNDVAGYAIGDQSRVQRRRTVRFGE